MVESYGLPSILRETSGEWGRSARECRVAWDRWVPRVRRTVAARNHTTTVDVLSVLRRPSRATAVVSLPGPFRASDGWHSSCQSLGAACKKGAIHVELRPLYRRVQLMSSTGSHKRLRLPERCYRGKDLLAIPLQPPPDNPGIRCHA